MALVTPDLPDLDVDAWRRLPHRDRVRPMAQHWVEHGFGTPALLHLVYLLKIVAYAAGGLALIAATTPDTGPLGEVWRWGAQLAVLQKVIIWTLLWEVLGLGCGFGALTLHFWPPMGGPLHWLRPGTIRLPPWPDRVPLTRRTERTWVDVLLYAALVGAGVRALLSADVDAGTVAPLVVLVPLLGLRDKVVFLAARAEQYWPLLIVMLFPDQLVPGTMAVMLAVWWGAATSKLNGHFPSVVAVMMSNSPAMRVRAIRRRMYRDPPEDLRPSRLAALLAHGGTVVELLVPAVLVITAGGLPTRIALVVMVVFHLHILSTFPMGVPLEWNVFVVYAALVVFGANAEVTIVDLDDPLLAVLLLIGVLLGPVLGNLRPDLTSFLTGMRYYAGNWATTMWLFRPDVVDRIDDGVTKAARRHERQLAMFYDTDTAEQLLWKVHAWRGLHVSGRGLTALLPRAVDDLDDRVVRDGEAVAGWLLGYNFGEGHFHGRQLLDAVRERVPLAAGDVRVVTLESQPIGNPTQRWTILDGDGSVVDEGVLRVSDLAAQQPWVEGEVPVHSMRDAPPAADLSAAGPSAADPSAADPVAHSPTADAHAAEAPDAAGPVVDSPTAGT